MGGFAFCDSDGGNVTWKAIHPITFKEKLEAGQIEMPTILEEEIKDKSKGDGLAKAIAIVQMTWFSAQLIIRLSMGWAATALEVITFATCVMAVGMYCFWWYKPLNIKCQTAVVRLPGSAEKEGQVVDAEQDTASPKGSVCIP